MKRSERLKKNEKKPFNCSRYGDLEGTHNVNKKGIESSQGNSADTN